MAEKQISDASVRRTVLGLWKSRLPALVFPVLAGIYKIQPSGFPSPTVTNWSIWLQLLPLFGISFLTGYWRLPFSVTWGLVLLLAFALATELLFGVAVIVSLTMLFGWYGVRLFNPHVISALWGGTKNDVGDDFGANGCTLMSQRAWKVWDLCVHAMPAAVLLYRYGPSISFQDYTVHPGITSVHSLAVALPVNALWFLGLQLGLPSGRRSMQLADSNFAYEVSPNLSPKTWLRIYCMHWVVCALWMGLLVLPKEIIFVYGSFVSMGLTRQPFTLGWWIIFLMSMLSRQFSALLEGMVWCTALTTGVGFYGAQVCCPYIFDSLVHSVMERQRWWAPKILYSFTETRVFSLLARLGDICLHLLPLSYAMYRFVNSVTATAALIVMPANIVYLFATGYSNIYDTNLIYQVKPDPPAYMWKFIYGSHLVICGSIWIVCMLTATSSVHV